MKKKRKRKKSKKTGSKKARVFSKAYRRPKKCTRESLRWYEMQTDFLAEGVEPEFVKLIAEPHYSLAVSPHKLRSFLGL